MLKKILPNRATEVCASIIVPVAAISESMVSRSKTMSAPVLEREKSTDVSAASSMDFLTASTHSSDLPNLEKKPEKYFFHVLFLPSCSSALRISGWKITTITTTEASNSARRSEDNMTSWNREARK